MENHGLATIRDAILALNHYEPTIDKHGRWIAVAHLRLHVHSGIIFRLRGRTSTQLTFRGLDAFVRLVKAECSPRQAQPAIISSGPGQDELEAMAKADFMRRGEILLDDQGAMIELTARNKHAYKETDHSLTRLAVLELARHGFEVRRCTGTHLKVGRLADIYPTTGRICVAGGRAQRVTLAEMISILKRIVDKSRLAPGN